MRPVTTGLYRVRMAHYLSFVAFAAVLAIAPGPDTLLTLRSTLLGGRERGKWTVLGICIAGATQGMVAASGLGALLVSAESVFLVLRWVGAAYLAYLGVMAIRAAIKAPNELTAPPAQLRASGRWSATRQGFLCNLTNPKVLAFNLAVLPQFVGTHASFATLSAYALTLTAVGAVVLVSLLWAAGAAARALQKVRVRRGIEGATGLVMLGFAGALIADAG